MEYKLDRLALRNRSLFSNKLDFLNFFLNECVVFSKKEKTKMKRLCGPISKYSSDSFRISSPSFNKTLFLNESFIKYKKNNFFTMFVDQVFIKVNVQEDIELLKNNILCSISLLEQTIEYVEKNKEPFFSLSIQYNEKEFSLSLFKNKQIFGGDKVFFEKCFREKASSDKDNFYRYRCLATFNYSKAPVDTSDIFNLFLTNNKIFVSNSNENRPYELNNLYTEGYYSTEELCIISNFLIETKIISYQILLNSLEVKE